MTTDENTDAGPEQDTQAAERVNPAENTAPPSNPDVDTDAVEKGKAKLDEIVNW